MTSRNTVIASILMVLVANLILTVLDWPAEEHWEGYGKIYLQNSAVQAIVFVTIVLVWHLADRLQNVRVTSELVAQIFSYRIFAVLLFAFLSAMILEIAMTEADSMGRLHSPEWVQALGEGVFYVFLVSVAAKCLLALATQLWTKITGRT